LEAALNAGTTDSTTTPSDTTPASRRRLQADPNFAEVGVDFDCVHEVNPTWGIDEVGNDIMLEGNFSDANKNFVQCYKLYQANGKAALEQKKQEAEDALKAK
jgi:hypothetical protein